MAHQAIAEMRPFADEHPGEPRHLPLEFEEPHFPNLPSKPFLNRYDPAAIEPSAKLPEPFADKPYIQRQMPVTWKIDEWTWTDWRPLSTATAPP